MYINTIRSYISFVSMLLRIQHLQHIKSHMAPRQGIGLRWKFINCGSRVSYVPLSLKALVTMTFATEYYRYCNKQRRVLRLPESAGLPNYRKY